MIWHSILLGVVLFATLAVGIFIGYKFRGIMDDTETNIIIERYD